MTILETGDQAPAFDLPANGGDNLQLADFRGKWVALYFYPKDMTPGCTTESQDFRDLFSDFTRQNTTIVGVSRDSVRRHDKFVAKHDLPFPLVSDESGTMCEDYGVWKLKKLYGREYMGIERSTFLIDPMGIIRHIWPKVKVKGHADDVLRTLQEL